jgi:hypothetical protein
MFTHEINHNTFQRCKNHLEITKHFKQCILQVLIQFYLIYDRKLPNTE